LALRLGKVIGGRTLADLRAVGVEPTAREAEAIVEGDPYLIGLAAQIIEAIRRPT
jgi:hypothetical protein